MISGTTIVADRSVAKGKRRERQRTGAVGVDVAFAFDRRQHVVGTSAAAESRSFAAISIVAA